MLVMKLFSNILIEIVNLLGLLRFNEESNKNFKNYLIVKS